MYSIAAVTPLIIAIRKCVIALHRPAQAVLRKLSQSRFDLQRLCSFSRTPGVPARACHSLMESFSDQATELFRSRLGPVAAGRGVLFSLYRHSTSTHRRSPKKKIFDLFAIIFNTKYSYKSLNLVRQFVFTKPFYNIVFWLGLTSIA